MNKLKIAFDVDDTLIIPAVALKDEPHPYIGIYGAIPNYEVISIYRFFQKQGHSMIIWSGGGVDYARRWADKLGLEPNEIIIKEKNESIAIAFDDCDIDLAKVNIKVKRLNNGVDRSEWNKHEAQPNRNDCLDSLDHLGIHNGLLVYNLNIMADTKNYYFLILIAILILGMMKYSLSNTEPLREPIGKPRGNINTIYRCCEDKCFLLKSLTDQSPIKEVTYIEIFESYDDGTIIFSNRWCGWD